MFVVVDALSYNLLVLRHAERKHENNSPSYWSALFYKICIDLKIGYHFDKAGKPSD